MSAPILALCANAKEAATAHYLASPQIKCVDTAAIEVFGDLVETSAVIFSRNLFASHRWLQAARSANIPRYYFMDENVLTMREEPHHHTHFYHEHTEQALRMELQDFEGVLVPNLKLADYLRAQNIHPNVLTLPPAARNVARNPAAQALVPLQFSKPRVVRLAYFSAPMRQGLFAQVVLPALRKLAHHHNIELVAFGCAPHSLDDASSPLRVRTPAWEPDYTKALAALQSWNPEIILQPDIETLSTPYKLPHMLLTAASVGAALVASRISPYTELANQAHQSVVLAANSGASWQESIRLLLDSEGLRHRLATNAIAYVRESFKTEANLNVIAHIAEQHRAPDLTARSHRAIALEPCLSAAKNTAAAIANNHRHTMRQQELATAQYQRDIADIEASLADSRRILALHAVTAR